MNGRRLYDRYTDAYALTRHYREQDRPLAWPFLNWNEQAMWRRLAKALDPLGRTR